jgi:membrane-associated phospholipid phosphatase
MVEQESWLDELRALDGAAYAAVARTPTPRLDTVLRPLTSAADHSKIWVATAAASSLLGGEGGRRGAADGLAAVGLASATVNLVFKHLSRRPRPDRGVLGVPQARHVEMPLSTSFPSGHSASAFAFAGGMAHAAPALGLPLHVVAVIVAYTRVHSGVHYPGDVVAGSIIGIACGLVAPRAVDLVEQLVASTRTTSASQG